MMRQRITSTQCEVGAVKYAGASLRPVIQSSMMQGEFGTPTKDSDALRGNLFTSAFALHGNV
jgi:cystathionine beta-lyase family protein involved in aluminum resistance